MVRQQMAIEDKVLSAFLSRSLHRFNYESDLTILMNVIFIVNYFHGQSLSIPPSDAGLGAFVPFYFTQNSIGPVKNHQNRRWKILHLRTCSGLWWDWINSSFDWKGWKSPYDEKKNITPCILDGEFNVDHECRHAEVRKFLVTEIPEVMIWGPKYTDFF